jgi:cytidine deaminase
MKLNGYDFGKLVSFLKRKRVACNSGEIARQYQSHSCAIINKNNGNIMSIGHNKHYVEYSNKFGMQHAEMNAIEKFVSSPLYQGLKRQSVDLFVIRTNDGNSRPCANCISRISNSGLNISKVYYSNIVNNQKGISAETIGELCEETTHTSSFYKNCCHNHDTTNKSNSDLNVNNTNQSLEQSDDEEGGDEDDDENKKKRILSDEIFNITLNILTGLTMVLNLMK